MGIWGWIGCIAAALMIGGFAVMLVFTSRIAKGVYRSTLVRTEPEKWGRECSAPDNEEQLAMWNIGVAWGDAHRAQATEVSVRHDGLQLYGEYFDFGSDRCVIILPGRCESLMYSYFFAEPYRAAGMNVLVIDQRAHGRSDGIYNTIGVKESGDVLAWVNYVCNTLQNREVWFHSICVGTSTALLAMTREDCPDAVKGLVTEGCFVSFRETFKRHMILDKRPLFPVLDLVMLNIRRYAGTNVYRDKPIRVIKRLRQRALFLYGREDVFSIPSKSQQLFDACGSEDKKLVWFEHGNHSHLRLTNTEAYDKAIVEYVNHG